MKRFREEAEPSWKDTDIRPTGMEEEFNAQDVDYGDEDMVESSAASQQAKQMGLKHMGFGRYGKSGKVTAITRGGKLVPVKTAEPAKPASGGEEPEAPATEPASIAKKGSRPAMSFEPTRDMKRDFEVRFIDAINGMKPDDKAKQWVDDFIQNATMPNQDPEKAGLLAKKWARELKTAGEAAKAYLAAEEAQGLPPTVAQAFYQKARDLAFLKYFGKEPQAQPQVTKPQNKISVPSVQGTPDAAALSQLGPAAYGGYKEPDSGQDEVPPSEPPQRQEPPKQKQAQATVKGLQTLDQKLGQKMGSEGWQSLQTYIRKPDHPAAKEGKKNWERYLAGVQKAVGDRRITQATADKLEDENNHTLMFALDHIGALKGTDFDGKLKNLYTRQAPSAGPTAPPPKPKKPVTPQIPYGAGGATPLGLRPPKSEPRVPAKVSPNVPMPKATPPKATPPTSLKRGGKTGSRPAMSGPQPDKAQKRDFEVKFMDAMNAMKADPQAHQEVKGFQGDPKDFAHQYTNAAKAAKAYAAAEDANNPRLAQELYKRTRDLAYLQHFGKTGQAKSAPAGKAQKVIHPMGMGGAPPPPPSAQDRSTPSSASSEPDLSQILKQKGTNVFKNLPPDAQKQIADILKKAAGKQPPKKAEPEIPPAGTQANKDVKRVAEPGTPERQQQIRDLVFDSRTQHKSPLTEETLNKLDKLGLQVEKPIASGTRGTAYLLANGKVLKATNDRSEAITSKLLAKNPHPAFPKIGKVFTLKGATPPAFGSPEQLFIEQEHLNPLPAQYRGDTGTPEGKRFLSGISDLAETYQASGSPAFSDPEELLSLWRGQFGQQKAQQFRELMNTGDKEMNRKMFTTIMSGVQHLNKMGIEYHDIWWKNLMTDKKGNPKIIDVGYTKGQGLQGKKVRQLKDWWKHQ